MLTHCPDCAFAPTEPIEVGQTGKLLSTPPITYFATSMFLDKAPFGRGRVVLEGADTALSIMLYTTTGILTPGIMKRGQRSRLSFKTSAPAKSPTSLAYPHPSSPRSRFKTRAFDERA